MTWKARAACADTPTAVFYPQPGDDWDVARLVCRGCPVRAECAEAGAAETFGIWGGRPAKSIRRRRRQARDRTVEAWPK